MLRVHFGLTDLARVRFGGAFPEDLAGACLEEALNRVHPDVRWCPPTLLVNRHPERDVHLDGRGLVVVLGAGCSEPTLTEEGDRPATLCCPLGPAPRPDEERLDALTGVFGRTRVRILHALRQESTTSDLAQRLAVSPSTASQGATELRKVGLIASRRDGGAVRHRLTGLGWRILTESPLRDG
ncbi:winged helix-turn-helix domain-containing protein [Actinosynnema sp. NPDC047251]|nr:winged helix-turn-helix domain-containing protein [Saccharothrix espanaensis]